ncbi:MAG: hypothetical protein ACI4C3_05570 [Bacteroides sp.]
MKKKFMMVTLLLAGLTMGACVDDKESASVTAVRDAKTEQLESVAAMNSAAAEAKQAIAAAEAALKLAEAQAKQAAADLQKANAEYEKKQAELMDLQKEQKTIENQKKQAALESQLAQLEVEKKRIEKQMAQIQADMEKAQVESEAALLRAEAAMKEAEQALLDYEKELADAKTQAEKDRIEAERAELEQLAYAYYSQVDALNTMKTQVNQVKAYIISCENTLVSFQDAKKTLVAQYTNDITQLQIEIDALKKYANYTEDFAALELEFVTLQAERNRARDIYRAALSDFTNYVENTEASDALQEEVDKDALYNLIHWNLVDENGDNYYRSDESIVLTHYDVASLLSYNLAYKNLQYSFEKGDYSHSTSFGDNFGDSLYVDIEREEDLRQFELNIEWWIDHYKSNLDNYTKAAANYQRAYNGAATEGDYGVLVDDGNGNMVSSTKACKNMVDSTAYLKTKYDAAADADKAALRTAYEDQLAREQACKTNLDNSLTAKADAQLELDCFNKEVDIIRNFDTYNAALQAKIKARNEQLVKDYEEKVALWMDYIEKYIDWEIAYDEYDVVSRIYYGSWNTSASSIDQQIKAKEDEIAQKKAAIEDVSQIESQEQLIETAKAYLEVYNQLIAIQEINVQNAKADLEAAMAKYAGTETEE